MFHGLAPAGGLRILESDNHRYTHTHSALNNGVAGFNIAYLESWRIKIVGIQSHASLLVQSSFSVKRLESP